MIVDVDSLATRGAKHHPPAPHTAALMRQLIAERQRQGLSARALVERLGYGWSLHTLRNYESGRATPSPEYLNAWARGLGLRLALVPDTPEQTP